MLPIKSESASRPKRRKRASAERREREGGQPAQAAREADHSLEIGHHGHRGGDAGEEGEAEKEEKVRVQTRRFCLKPRKHGTTTLNTQIGRRPATLVFTVEWRTARLLNAESGVGRALIRGGGGNLLKITF